MKQNASSERSDIRGLQLALATVHAGLRIAVGPRLSVAEAAAIASEVERRVHEGTQSAHCFVQAEPAAA